MNIEQLKGKAVAILGVGMEGIALAHFLLDFTENITLLDKLSQGELEDRAKENGDEKLSKILSDSQFKSNFGPNYLDNLHDFEIVFRSPGIPYLEPKIQEAKGEGVIISSQIKLFFDLCPCLIIGVTGTKGKGTTSSLIFEMMKKNQNRLPRPEGLAMTASNEAMKQSSNVYLAGNIGEPAITLIDKLTKDDIVILELSSFQLQDMDKSPHIAVVLNISIDHLDYHKDEIEYKDAKINIVKHQTKDDYAIINQDYLTSFKFASETNGEVYYFSDHDSVDTGAYVRQVQNFNSHCEESATKQSNKNRLPRSGGLAMTDNNEPMKQSSDDLYEVVLKIDDREEIICRSDEIQLLGKHNLENIAAAAITAKLTGADIESIRLAAKEFKGLPHRLELVAEINGVRYYNDSFATNPGPTMAAINSFAQPIHLILGGSSKGADFSEMAELIRQSNVSSVNLIGAEAENIKNTLIKSEYHKELSIISGDINNVVSEVSKKTKPGDIVLFSPACASFDMFKNYKDRGEKFKQAVLKLSEE